MPDSALPDTTVLTSSFYETYIRPQVIVTCTSATRPTGVEGRRIYETDTDLEYCHDGTNWILVGGNAGWTTHTPQIDQGATTNIAKTVTYSKWARGPRRTITWTFTLQLTAAGTAGSKVTVTLPVTAESALIPLGAGFILDTGTANYAGSWRAASTTTAQFETDATSLNGWGATPSVALASGDILYGTLTYPASA